MGSTPKKDLFGTSSLAEKLKKASEEMIVTDKKAAKPQPKNTVKKLNVEPKLYVSGHLDRKRHKYLARSLVIPEAIESEIKAYCRGGDLAVLNYLIVQGLNSIKTSKDIINIDTKDIFKDVKA